MTFINSYRYASSGFAFGNALKFDGSNDYVSFDDTSVYCDKDSAWSIGLWAKLDSWGSDSYKTILKLNTGITNSPYRILFSSDSSYADLSFGAPSSNIGNYKVNLDSGGGITLSTWYFIVITYNGAGATISSNWKVYVNGVSDSFSTASGFGLPTAAPNSEIGRYNNNQFWDGVIDEFAFWDSELTASNVSNLWNSGNGNFANVDVTPRTWWRLNESGTDTTATDSSGNGNDGTLNNFPASGMWVAH